MEIFTMPSACNVAGCLLYCQLPMCVCVCGVSFTVVHTLSYSREGSYLSATIKFVTITHLLKDDAYVELGLQPLTGESLSCCSAV